jgi:hypothetical protein
MVYRDASGALVRGRAADDGGAIEIIETEQWQFENGQWQPRPPSFGVNHCSPATGCLIGWSPDFSTEPRLMILNGNPDELYAAVGQPDVVPPSEHHEAFAIPLDACTSPSTPIPSDWGFDEVRAAIARRWLSCGGSPTEVPGDVGMDLDPSGEWHRLISDSPNTLYRGHGFDREGHWELLDDGSGSYSLQVSSRGSGFFSGAITISSEQPRMEFAWMNHITYVGG